MSRIFRKSTFRLGDTSRGEDGTTSRRSTLWTTDLNKSGLAQHLIRWRKDNVWDYYDIGHQIGEGSIGTVRLVKRKFGKEGGTAYAEGQKRINSVRGGFGCCSSTKTNDTVVEGGGVSTTKTIPNRPYFPRSKHTEYYALKSIHLSLVDKLYLEELRNEIDVIRGLDHINIIKAYEVYETKTNIFVVMEYLSGGDLYTRSPYTEYESASVVCQLCSAICFIHKNGVVHRDIKMENIMFETTSPSAKIKVLDFGLSKKYSGRSEVLHGGGSGTVYTMSPEALSGSYNAKADCWSIGVIAYLLLCGERPFKGETRKEVVQNVKQGKYNFNHPTCWDTITQTAKDFVSSLLVHDQGERLSAEAALRHSWLRTKKFTSTVNLTKLIAEEEEQALNNNTGRNTRNHVRVNTQMLMRDVKDNIVAYKEASELYKIAAMVVAHQSSTAEILDIRRAFAKLDKDNEGIITRNQFKQGMAEFRYTDDELDEMFSKVVSYVLSTHCLICLTRLFFLLCSQKKCSVITILNTKNKRMLILIIMVLYYILNSLQLH